MTVQPIPPIKLPVQRKNGTVRLSPATLTVGTSIMTANGERLVEDLKAGDRVLTKDFGMQAIKCVAFRDTDLSRTPERAPICIPAHAFGEERPLQDLFVAPEQRIALRHRMFDVLFACREVLARAADLVGNCGIYQTDGLRGITYVSLGFCQHHLIYSGNLALDLGPTHQTTSRPTLSCDEARLACSLLKPHVTHHQAAAGFPLH